MDSGLRMLRTILVLCGFQLLGEALAALFGLPVPGPVVGMGLLLMVLIIRGRITARFQQHCHALFAYLPLLLVPPSVGVLLHLDLILAQWPPITAVLFLTLLVSLIVGALLYRLTRSRWA